MKEGWTGEKAGKDLETDLETDLEASKRESCSHRRRGASFPWHLCPTKPFAAGRAGQFEPAGVPFR
jgi:hypothetical protein